MTPTWFEHATFWSGVRRATVAPRSHMKSALYQISMVINLVNMVGNVTLAIWLSAARAWWETVRDLTSTRVCAFHHRVHRSHVQCSCKTVAVVSRLNTKTTSLHSFTFIYFRTFGKVIASYCFYIDGHRESLISNKLGSWRQRFEKVVRSDS